MIAGEMREVYRVGKLVLDVGARLLTRGGELVTLPPKTFELLVELVRRAPGVVRRRELMDTVWPKQFVNDEALTQRVMLLRRALGDDPRKPTYIASVPRWGYRLAATVERVAATTSHTTVPHGDPGRSECPCVLVYGDRQIPLPEGESILGRDPGARVRVDSLDVSRRHARIVVSFGRAVLEDLGSKNGTFLCGRRLEGPAELADGDAIAVGPVVLTFRVVGVAGSTFTRSVDPSVSE